MYAYVVLDTLCSWHLKFLSPCIEAGMELLYMSLRYVYIGAQGVYGNHSPEPLVVLVQGF